LSSPQIPQQEVADWFDNPITEHFFSAIENALKAVEEDKKGAKRATPLETQMRFEFLDGCEWAFTDLLEYRDFKTLPGVGDE
jgi:hypothetical protein